MLLVLHMPQLLMIEVMDKGTLDWISFRCVGIDIVETGMLIHRHASSTILATVHVLGNIEVEVIQIIIILRVALQAVLVGVLLEIPEAFKKIVIVQSGDAFGEAGTWIRSL